MIKAKNGLSIIAEIGVNHEGNFDKALELTQLAAEAGADIIKFQSYTADRFIAAHDPVRRERVKRFALTKEDHLKLFELTRSLNVEFMSTPVTEDWVDFLDPLCRAFKIASGDITFKLVIQEAAKTGKPVILSTGAATIDQIDQAVEWVSAIAGRDKLPERLILMHCVSAYPTPINEANILSIPFLKQRYGLKTGYSNHVIGMNACLAAVALGAEVVEVHFTDQKDGREFRDHSLSFDHNDLKQFVKSAYEIKDSLGEFNKIIQPCESMSVAALKKGIVAAHDLKKGEVLSFDKLMFARPATEFPANDIENLIGKTINQDIGQGYLIPRSAVECVE